MLKAWKRDRNTGHKEQGGVGALTATTARVAREELRPLVEGFCCSLVTRQDGSWGINAQPRPPILSPILLTGPPVAEPSSSQRPGEPDDAIHMGDGVTGESASWGADREEKGGAGVWRDKQRMSSQVVEGTRAVPGTHCHITNLPRTLAGNNRH